MTNPSPNPVESLRALPELLPCPFCGSHANGPYRVKMKNVNWAIDCSMHCCLVQWHKTEKQAVAAWNRRPASAPDVELAKQLIDCVPTTWLDSLLTGKDAVVAKDGKHNGLHIEALLNGIRKRMQAILAKHSTAAEE